MYASEEGHRACLELLIVTGASVDERNERGETACDVARRIDNQACVRDLQLHAQRTTAIHDMLSARFGALRMTDDPMLAVLVSAVSQLAYAPAV